MAAGVGGGTRLACCFGGEEMGWGMGGTRLACCFEGEEMKL
jgi:hypothetical protein